MSLKSIIRIGCLVYLAGLTYLLFTPELPDLTQPEAWWIRLVYPAVHFLAMFTLTLLVLASNWRLSAAAIVTLLLLYAFGTECIQPLFPPRTFEVKDLAQNVGGIGTAWGLWWMIVGTWRRRKRPAELLSTRQWRSFLRGTAHPTAQESEEN